MNILESFRIATRAVFANKVRSLLTMLGVIIGVSAVILLVAIGTGVQKDITGTIEGLGSNLLFVFPGQINTSGGGFGGPPQQGHPFSNADAKLLQTRLSGADAVVPVASGSGTVKLGNKSGRSMLMGATEQGAQVFSATLGGGRHYNRSEVDASARVVAIGYTIKESLFPSSDPLGQVITINGQRFTVIGWYEKQGGSLSGDQD
ncbi:MAG TPA: ABC transporter permease, partial [Coriobacteriia bacterium]